MPVSKNKVVSFDYTLTDDDGNLIDTSEGEQPLSYIHGIGQLIPGMEKALNSRQEGDSFKVEILPHEAYGEYEDNRVFELGIEEIAEAENIDPGDELILDMDDEGELSVVVLEIRENGIVVDGNHPLAGKTLNFKVTVRSIREATEEEIDHGQVQDGTENR